MCQTLTVSVLIMLSVWAMASAASPPCEMAKLTASDGQPFAYFGTAVYIDGDHALVGAEADNFGSAYVFRREGNDWLEEDKLIASDGTAQDYFGHAVSLSDGYALVGAQGDDEFPTPKGAAYVFRREGVAWTEEAKLIASDAEATDYFGCAVSISEDRAAIGAKYEDALGNGSGSVYIFRREGRGWVEEIKLTASDGAAGDGFGYAVSLREDGAADQGLLIVGAPFQDPSAPEAGAAYVFRRDGAVWTEEAKLTAGDGEEDDYFGISVSLADGLAVIGANYDDDQGQDAGSAYIFRRNGFSWTEEAKLMASDGEDRDFFGCSVSVSGKAALIGAEGDNSFPNPRGAAYVFRHTGSTWTEEAKITASDASISDYFGASVSIGGDYAICGAVGDDDLGAFSGSVLAFGLSGFVCPTVNAEMGCQPVSGTLPFPVRFTVRLTNLYSGQARRIAGHLDLTLANQQFFPNWRSGYTTVGADGSYTTLWNTNLPLLGLLVGDNTFQLVAEDVTPAPYNLPPYPPSGDSGTDSCIVTGIRP